MTSDSYFRDAREKMLSGVPGYETKLRAIAEERKRTRSGYNTENGIKELARQCKGAGLFTKLDPENVLLIGRHNMMVDILDDMGLLDEANIESIIGYMLSLPVIPGGEREEK